MYITTLPQLPVAGDVEQVSGHFVDQSVGPSAERYDGRYSLCLSFIDRGRRS